MKTPQLIATLAFTLFLAGCHSSDCCAAPSKLKLTDCPDAVQKTFAAQLGKSTLIEAEKETGKDGKSIYEAKIKTADGKDGEIVVAPDGTLIQNEVDVSLKDCPAVVQTGLQGAVKGGKIVKVEKITKADGTIQFEADITKKDGEDEEDMEVIVAADGKVISVVEVDDDDEDKDDEKGAKKGKKEKDDDDEKDEPKKK